MKRLVLTSLAICLGSALSAGIASASGAEHLPYTFEPDTGNQAALQRGARDYMAYCAGCHSLKYLRYNRVAQDAGIPEDLLTTYLMPKTAKVGDPILTAMPAESAQWFGQKPPDLSLTSRLRTPSWVYSYLMTFYTDPSRPNGVNNLVLPGASMPHVLWELQGWQELVESEHGEAAEPSGHHAPAVPLKLVHPGSLSEKEYAARVGDITTFLAYAAEPGKQARIAMGGKVMVYLLLLFVLAYLLKKEFWRDVH